MMVCLINCLGLDADVELENSRHHNDCLRSVPILEHRKFDCFGAPNEQASTETLLILCDPIPAAVFADAKEPQRRTWTCRRRFRLAHDVSLVFRGR